MRVSAPHPIRASYGVGCPYSPPGLVGQERVSEPAVGFCLRCAWQVLAPWGGCASDGVFPGGGGKPSTMLAGSDSDVNLLAAPADPARAPEPEACEMEEEPLPYSRVDDETSEEPLPCPQAEPLKRSPLNDKVLKEDF